VSGGGCSDWQPSSDPPADFVVAGDYLVASAQGECPSGTTAAREPLFIKDLRGGHWRVLRWLAGASPPILAAEGDTLAIGVQYSVTALDVVLLSVANGRVEAHFNLPDGYLAFASPARLVLSTPEALLESRQGAFR
jgi:hypothetical protein